MQLLKQGLADRGECMIIRKGDYEELKKFLDIREIVDYLKLKYLNIWWSTKVDFYKFEREIKLSEKLFNERKIERFRKELLRNYTICLMKRVKKKNGLIGYFH